MAAPAKALGKGQQAPQVPNRSTPSKTAETDVPARDGDCQNSLEWMLISHIHAIQPQTPALLETRQNTANSAAGWRGWARYSPACTRDHLRCHAPKQKSLASQRMRGFFSIKL